MYKNIFTAEFLERPNRFIAICRVGDMTEACHVKNTGRCTELLIRGVPVLLEKSDNPSRKTKYDLVAVYKGERLINIDSQLPNDAAEEFLPRLFPDLISYRREKTYGNSRFDFYAERSSEKLFLEVKGVTLEKDGAVFFPDAPTERGRKHLNELIACRSEGYGAYLLFVIQMNGVKSFSPNRGTDPEFAAALENAAEHGVKLLAYDCLTDREGIVIDKPVEIILG